MKNKVGRPRKKKNSVSENSKKEEVKKRESSSLESDLDVLESPQQAKIDVFEFMMNSRHKSIGRNSPGKESPNNEVRNEANKEQLKARKDRLADWAEKKGASKRKREYEEVTELIEHKLDKRAKKLKKMLGIESPESDINVVQGLEQEQIAKTTSDNQTGKRDGKKQKLLETESDYEYEVGRNKRRTRKLNLDNDCELTKRGKTKRKVIRSGKTLKEINEKRDSGIKSDHEVVKPQANNKNVLIIMDNEDDAQNEQVNQNQEANYPRRSLRPRKTNGYIFRSDEETHQISDDEYIPQGNKKKKNKNLAPVFLKSVPKPKMDPATIEARRQFLLSGVPTALKIDVEKSSNSDLVDVEFFPTISHIQQRSENNRFWKLESVNLDLEKEDVALPSSEALFQFKYINRNSTKGRKIKNFFTPIQDLNKIKTIVKEIKNKEPDYPIFKMFNIIFNKGGHNGKENNKKSGKSKSRNESLDVIDEDTDSKSGQMWTEKYRPKNGNEIIGNTKVISWLKEWLLRWSSNTSQKHKKKIYSDEDFTEEDSSDSVRMLGNTVILKGPSSSGKSSSVHALCNELDFQVLEVNVSSRRTGKWLMQELQEATQSHQLQKQEIATRKCVLLIDDIDIVFDQDEGLSAALLQILTSSKRPVILTMTHPPALHIEKILSNYRSLKFELFPKMALRWLELVCLRESFHVERTFIEKLLNSSNNDVRQTLLRLQFLVTNAGDVHIGGKENELEVLWWNSPKFLDKVDNVDKFSKVCSFYDSMSLCDVITRDEQRNGRNLGRRWRGSLKDSLSLEVNHESYVDKSSENDLVQELLIGHVKQLEVELGFDFALDFGVPDAVHQRLYLKQKSCDEKLEGALLVLNALERRANALDYMSTLRAIAKSEDERKKNNEKRTNRFSHYLRELGVEGGESTYTTACNVFQLYD